MIREELNRGLGQAITANGTVDFKMHKGQLGALRKLKAKVAAAENAGGLSDTMADRATIAIHLAQLLTAIEDAGVDEEIALIHVDFVGGGYRWEGPGGQVLARTNDERDVEREITAPHNTRLRENGLADMVEAAAEAKL